MSRWAILVLVTLAHALGALAVLSVAPLSPFLLDALHLSRAQVGLLLPAVYLGGVLMSLPAGWLTHPLRRPVPRPGGPGRLAGPLTRPPPGRPLGPPPPSPRPAGSGVVSPTTPPGQKAA